MNQLTIQHHKTGNILFSGAYPSLRYAVEQAVRDHVCLDFADLRRANLVNAALDEAQLRQARFDGANLMGANLSEACLDGADFTNAGLQNACLCHSSLRHCRFEGSLFGATDINGSILDRSVFSTLSALQLDFGGARSMELCLFVDPAGPVCPLSRPPLILGGLPYPVVLMDSHIKIGGWLGRHEECLRHLIKTNKIEEIHDLNARQRDCLAALLALKSSEKNCRLTA